VVKRPAKLPVGNIASSKPSRLANVQSLLIHIIEGGSINFGREASELFLFEGRVIVVGSGEA
jgi:hypothetical protein